MKREIVNARGSIGVGGTDTDQVVPSIVVHEADKEILMDDIFEQLNNNNYVMKLNLRLKEKSFMIQNLKQRQMKPFLELETIVMMMT